MRIISYRPVASSPFTVLDRLQDAVFAVNAHGRIVFWNVSAGALYGWTPEQAIGQQADMLLYGAESAQFQKTFETVRSHRTWAGEHRQVTMQGREIVVEARWSLLEEGADGAGMLVFNTDITERKKHETQALRMQRLESLGTLAGGIAHDMNNILGPILVSVQLLKMRATDETEVRILDTLEASARRGADLLKKLLSFARGVEGQHTRFDVSRLLEEIRPLLAGTFPKSIRLSFHAPDALWPVRGDMTQMHQVIMNLCVNARDALPDGGEIWVRARNVTLDGASREGPPGAYVRITVADNGCGMTPEELDMAFEPFYTTKRQGTGLGLSTLLGIVRSHGGFVHVDSRLGGGTTFRVYLPATSDAAEHATPATGANTHHGEDKTVIIVDDEEAYRLTLRALLSRQGYRVLVASSGNEAAALLRRYREEIDLVITDIMMPAMDGRALIDLLKKEYPGVVVVAMSGGYTEAEWLETNPIADAFIAKPFESQHLFDVLAKWTQPVLR